MAKANFEASNMHSESKNEQKDVIVVLTQQRALGRFTLIGEYLLLCKPFNWLSSLELSKEKRMVNVTCLVFSPFPVNQAGSDAVRARFLLSFIRIASYFCRKHNSYAWASRFTLSNSTQYGFHVPCNDHKLQHLQSKLGTNILFVLKQRLLPPLNLHSGFGIALTKSVRIRRISVSE